MTATRQSTAHNPCSPINPNHSARNHAELWRGARARACATAKMLQLAATLPIALPSVARQARQKQELRRPAPSPGLAARPRGAGAGARREGAPPLAAQPRRAPPRRARRGLPGAGGRARRGAGPGGPPSARRAPGKRAPWPGAQSWGEEPRGRLATREGLIIVVIGWSSLPCWRVIQMS